MLKTKHIVISAVAGFSLAAAAVPLFAEADTQTTNSAIALSVSPVILTYTSGPTVTLAAIVPDLTGRESISLDTVSGTTNDGAGMTITLQAHTAGDVSMVAGAGTITSIVATPAVPLALTNGTWGFRVDSLAGFGATTTTTLSNAAPTATTFAAIPAFGSPYTIKSTATTGAATQSVWYGARLNTAQLAGNYTATVAYTFTTN